MVLGLIDFISSQAKKIIGATAQGITDFATATSKGITDIASGVLTGVENLYKDIVNGVVDGSIQIAGGITNLTQGILSPTLYNTITSYLRNLHNAVVSGVTNFNPNFLSDNTEIPLPTQQDLSKTPTVSEFLQAATTVYTYKGSVDGGQPFVYDGQQLGIVNSATGVAAKVWITAENQVIIAYQGTTGGETGYPVTSANQVLQDLSIMAKTVTPGEREAVKFAQFVVDQAQQRGYTTNDIFVTGHSLGAIEAEYVAQQTGLGGIGFNNTGLPLSDTGKGTGENFVNILHYGDPVSSYASDIEGEQPFAPVYDLVNGQLPHYGNNVFVGSIQSQQWLSDVSQDWGSGLILGKLKAASEYLLNGFPSYHTPVVMAKGLGVDLSSTIGVNGYVPIGEDIVEGDFTNLRLEKIDPVYGVNLNVGDKTIQSLLTFDSQRNDYHYSFLPHTHDTLSLAA